MEWYEILLMVTAFWGGYLIADMRREGEMREITDQLEEALDALMGRMQ